MASRQVSAEAGQSGKTPSQQEFSGFLDYPRRTGTLEKRGDGAEIVIQPIKAFREEGETTEERTFHSEVPYPHAPVSTRIAPPQAVSSGTRYAFENDEAVDRLYEREYAVARAPPQVMTALGPMPLPAEIRRKIPEKFVAKPIVEEREIYVAKKEVQERTVEVPHVHYEHKFAEVPTSLKVKKLVPRVTEVIREVPREVYKPVIEEKVIEVPQGVKYVEVPVEVACQYPPRIIPRPKVQVVERIVETIKPVIKEKIVEVPQTVVRQVPKVKTVEVPYYVPRYVEKVIEVPYQPPEGATLPPMMTGTLPSRIAAPLPKPFTVGPVALKDFKDISVPYEARIDLYVSHNPIHTSEAGQEEENVEKAGEKVSGGSPATTLSHSDQVASAIDLPEGFQWGAPGKGASAHAAGHVAAGMPGYPSGAGAGVMPPIMITCPPEVGRVKFAGYLTDPDILTRRGVMAYDGFKQKGNFQMLFPPLAPQAGVPMNPAGTPDVRSLTEIAEHVAAQQNTEVSETLQRRLQEEEESQGRKGFVRVLSSCAPCVPAATLQREVVYEQ